MSFLTVLILAIAGVAYTNISRQPLVGYWEFLALAMGVVCVVTEWSRLDERQARVRLIWTQALSNVQQHIPALATSLTLLILLALGTFLAGLNLLSPQIFFLGLALALAVPAIAWLKQSMLFLTMAVVFLVGLSLTFWLSQGDGRSAKYK